MILYNTMTLVCAVLVALLLVFIPLEFRMADPQRSANFGKIYDFPASDGLRAGPSLPQKDFR